MVLHDAAIDDDDKDSSEYRSYEALERLGGTAAAPTHELTRVLRMCEAQDQGRLQVLRSCL